MSEKEKEKEQLQRELEEAARKMDTAAMQVIQQKMNQILLKEQRPDA